MEKFNILALDRIDRKILVTIELDARVAISELSRKARVSRAVAEYRLRKLEQQGVVRGYYCLLDPSKFGLTVWKLWISLRAASSKEKANFFAYVENHPRVWWYAECIGAYDAVICVLSKTAHDFNKFFNALHDAFGHIIADSAILMNVSFEYHSRGFLLDTPSRLIESSFQERPFVRRISRVEMSALKLLCKNSRTSYAEISQSVGKNVKTVKKIMNDLKKSGIIVYFRPSLDTVKLGYDFYKVLVYLHNARGGTLPFVVHWCRAQKNIVAIISTVGPWQLELEVEIESFRSLSLMLTELRDKFPEVIRNYEVLLVTKEGNFQLDLMDKISSMQKHYG